MARKLELELQAKSNADVVLNRVQKASENFASNLVSRFTAAFGAMALFDKFTSFAAETFREFGHIADQVAKSGLAADQFQMLAYAAKQSGADIKDVTKAVRELNSQIAAAKQSPQGKEATRLQALGFSKEMIASGTIKATDVFLQLAKAMETAQSDADKTAIATALLGDKVGQNLVPMLEEGRASLMKLFGGAPIVDDKSLKSIDEANDKVDSFHARVKALGAQVEALGIKWFEMTKGFSLGGLGPVLRYFLNQEITGAVPAAELPAPDTKAFLNANAKATAEAALGSGVIGVGASPQVVLQQEANDKLDSIDMKLGELVRGSINTDFTKFPSRTHQLPAR